MFVPPQNAERTLITELDCKRPQGTISRASFTATASEIESPEIRSGAAIWALIVGSLMTGGAAIMGLPARDVVMVGALGGIGAAIFILFFAGSA